MCEGVTYMEKITLKRFIMITSVAAMVGLFVGSLFPVDHIMFWVMVLFLDIIIIDWIDITSGGRYE